MALPVDLKTLRKHAVIVGASGSGKTVAAKHILEELLLNGVKVIAIDPQGDIASMCLPSADAAFNAKKRVVYTPGSEAGLPLTLNPLTIRKDSDPRMIPAVAENIAGILDYDTRKSEGRSVISVLDYVLTAAHGRINTMDALRDVIAALFEPSRIIEPDPQELHMNNIMRNGAIASRQLGFTEDIPPKLKAHKVAATNKVDHLISVKNLKELTRRISQLTTGSKRELFCRDGTVTIPRFLQNDLSVVYLNTLYGPEEKMAVVASVATALYEWMLKNPARQLSTVFYIDEVSMFLPAGNKNTAAKESLKLLFQQGRKYGVGVILATQSPGGADYRAMSQASTWIIGKLTMRQDISKVRPQYANMPDQGMCNSQSGELSALAIDDLPSMRVGQFQILSPDYFKGIRVYKFPLPRTPHECLDEFDLGKIKN